MKESVKAVGRGTVLLGMLCGPALAQEQPVDDVLSVPEAYQDTAVASQQRVAELDDQTLALIARYNSELARYDDLVTYNSNLEQLLASQQREKDRLNSEIVEIEVVRQELVPLMVEMIDVLAQFIELDQPFLLDERQARLERLQDNLARSDVELAEKFRRLIEAYQIEAEYGQTIEAYEGTARIDGEAITVDLLRVGRLALYYMTLDRSRGGLWHPTDETWVDVSEAMLDQLDYAIRVARKQAPPNLLELPLWTEEWP